MEYMRAAPRPPGTPVINGNPTATSSKKIITDKNPRLEPKIAPANIIPMFCKTNGTGIKPKGIGGTNPNTIIIAVIIAINATFFVFNSLPHFLIQNI